MYHNYAKYFDRIFPANINTVDFLVHHLQGKSILDIGCGSGEYAIALSKKDYTITGIDLDSEMIAYAQNKNHTITFKIENMLEMDNTVFSSIYCIGNTLVHLPTKKDLETFLNQCYKKTTNTLILQIINYDRILDQQITSLPTITNKDITFTRNYTINQNTITFSTMLTAEGHTFQDSVTLLPLRKEELEMMLMKVGFKDIQYFDGFTNKEYNNDSYSLVVVANK